ncbi:MAG: hypothetical protein Q8K89_05510 [Actinomycetota bacterium]|nr:hypothetical protein [Actinomycetota bacterium]
MRRAIVFGTVMVFALLLWGCAPNESSQSTPPANLLMVAEGATISPDHGGYPSALDDPSFKGVSLAEGLAQASPAVKLPDEQLVGKPVKVVIFPPEEAQRDRIGLLIAFDNGVRLQALPGRSPLEALNVEAEIQNTPDNYTDSSPRPEMGSINGKVAFVRGAGQQILASRGTVSVRNVVAWMDGDTLYSMQASTESGLTLDDLIKAAESVH